VLTDYVETRDDDDLLPPFRIQEVVNKKPSTDSTRYDERSFCRQNFKFQKLAH
jgi:hypothetical protein